MHPSCRTLRPPRGSPVGARVLDYDDAMTSSNSSGERAPDPRPARTRAAIFTAARELSADDGEVTVNALAKRAGVSRAAFYSHFSGLDDLLAFCAKMIEAFAEEQQVKA